MHVLARFAVGVGAGLLLVGCGSTQVAAPVTSTMTVQRTISQTVTSLETVTTSVITTEASMVYITDTTQVTETKLKPVPTTVLKTVIKPVTVVQTATTTAPPAAAAVAFTDGTYIVGTQIQPGTYQANDSNPSGGLCYWERTSKDGTIIDNGVNNGVMTVQSSDFSVRVSGCGSWAAVG
jgi:hypothetical protein